MPLEQSLLVKKRALGTGLEVVSRASLHRRNPFGGGTWVRLGLSGAASIYELEVDTQSGRGSPQPRATLPFLAVMYVSSVGFSEAHFSVRAV